MASRIVLEKTQREMRVIRLSCSINQELLTSTTLITLIDLRILTKTRYSQNKNRSKITYVSDFYTRIKCRDRSCFLHRNKLLEATCFWASID